MKRGLGLFIAVLTLPTMCGAPNLAADTLPHPGSPPGDRPVLVDSNRVELLTDGFGALQRLKMGVSRARATIEAEIYEFDRADLASAMEAALARGVKVTLIEDPSVSVNAATAARLRGAGAHVRIFPDQARQIDHVKLLIVDGATAIFGGMNLSL